MKEIKEKNVKELALRYNVSRESIYLWIKRGLPHHKKRKGLNNIAYFDVDKTDEWVANNTRKRNS